MASSKKIIAIIGATGGQGGSVVKSVLGDPKMSANWAVRGITRDASKASSKQLAGQGVEVVEADLASKDSLVHAFQGAYAVYGVTNYWDKMDKDLEIQQGKNLADAALDAGVEHFIWSSLPNVKERSFTQLLHTKFGGADTKVLIVTHGSLPNVHHFDSKATVEAYIRTTSLPATFVMPGFYMANIPGGNMRPSPPDDAWTLSMPIPATAPVPLLATDEDIGKFVKGVLRNREKTLGKRVLAATKYYTFQEMIDAFKATYPEAGRTARYYETPKDVFKGFLTQSGMPDFAAQELLENMLLLNEGGYYGGESLEWSHSILEDKLTTWQDFIRTAKSFEGLK